MSMFLAVTSKSVQLASAASIFGPTSATGSVTRNVSSLDQVRLSRPNSS